MLTVTFKFQLLIQLKWAWFLKRKIYNLVAYMVSLERIDYEHKGFGKKYKNAIYEPCGKKKQLILGQMESAKSPISLHIHASIDPKLYKG